MEQRVIKTNLTIIVRKRDSIQFIMTDEGLLDQLRYPVCY